MIDRRLALALILASFPAAARAQNILDQGRRLLGSGGSPATGTAGTGASLSEGEIGGGLKEALEFASQRVVGRTGRTDSFCGDPAIRIPLPGALEQISSPLKAIGAGGLLDDLQLKINRAVEEAAPKALDIFAGAISKMSITDARGILSRPEGRGDAVLQAHHLGRPHDGVPADRSTAASSPASARSPPTRRSSPRPPACRSAAPALLGLQPHRLLGRQGPRRPLPLHGGRGGADPHRARQRARPTS